MEDGAIGGGGLLCSWVRHGVHEEAGRLIWKGPVGDAEPVPEAR